MITGFDDPELGVGAPLGDLAAARVPLQSRSDGRWAVRAPGTVAECARALIQRGHPTGTPARVLFVPGRIEVLGKHTDYAGGRSLLAAVERGFILVAVARSDTRVHVTALDIGETADFSLDPDLQPPAGWANYPMTVARRLARDFPGLQPGADIAIRSDLPPAAGMSSSSALVVGTFLCLAGTTRLLREPRFREAVVDADALASYLAAVESGQSFGRLTGDAGVGTHGGSEDHTAILRAREGSLLQYRFVPAALERTVALPPGYRFALAASGVQAEKTGAMRDRYNRASALARALHELWTWSGAESTPSLAAALRSSPAAADRLREVVRTRGDGSFPTGELLARLDHFLRESESIVPDAATALAEGRIDRFGSLVDDSQRLAENLLGNQVPETTELARSARRLGAAAASAFGAGYGGSVWALVEERRAEEFLLQWGAAYANAFPLTSRQAVLFDSGAGPAALRLA